MFLEAVITFFKKIKKIFHWIPVLWKVDDDSYISLYQVNIEQLTDMQKRMEKFSDISEEGMDYYLEMEEVKKNLFLATKETDSETAERYIQRAFKILNKYSLEWWL